LWTGLKLLCGLGACNVRETLFSPLWYRYSQQIPQLKQHVKVQQQKYRDQVWHLLINNNDESHFRINSTAYAFVGRCNGVFTVQEIWDSLLDSLGSQAPTQDEIIRLLNELDNKELLRYDVMPDVPHMFRRAKEKAKQKTRSFINPFAIRLPLWNPTPLLNQLKGLTRYIFNPVVFFSWLAVVLTGVIASTVHWNELYIHSRTYMGSARYLLIAWLSFPVIKAIHELGHALAVRHWGGEVRETGVTFFMLTPAPYVDASASSGFQRRRQRVVVGAIGIMVELALAAIALLIFLSVQPGLLRDIAFVVVFICSVSTLLFNGNPLLRFDAYYVMCDTFDVPNLAMRSRTFWVNQFTRWVVGKEKTRALTLASGERKWLFAYAPMSYIYSIVILVSVVLWLGSKSLIIGLLGILFILIFQFIKPLISLYKNIIGSAPIGIPRLKAKVVATLISAALAGVLLLLPVPHTTSAKGVVWIPDQAYVRPEVDGFIKQILVKNNEAVVSGQPLVILDNPKLIADRDQLKSVLVKLETDQFDALFRDPSKASAIEEQIKKLKAELVRSEEKIQALQLFSQVNGKVIMPHQDDLLGTYSHKGAILGYVLDKDTVNLRVALRTPDVTLVREKLQSIDVKTADYPNEALSAKVTMITPLTTHALPSPALGDRGGGSFVTDPADKDGINVLEPIVLVDLNLPSATFERAGVRANVRFNHGAEPIAKQAYRKFVQLFLQFFSTDV
jgi:putative peptide zinc metalloprotease protein